MLNREGLLRLGYHDRDLQRLHQVAAGRFERVDDIRRVLDTLAYHYDWRSCYRIQSVRSSLHGAQITCIDAAILAYGLLEFFPEVKRRLLAIHRRDQQGEECGHVVALYWGPDGRVGAFSKSSFPGLGHRDPVHADEVEVAKSYAMAYVQMGIQPLYFGVTSLEEAAGTVDWRFDPGDLNVLSDLIQAKYEYAFGGDEAADLTETVTTMEQPKTPGTPVAVDAMDLADIPGLLGRLGQGADLQRPALSFYRGRVLIGRLSHGELLAQVERVSRYLRDRLGIQPDDRIGVLSPNRLEVPVLLLAAMRLGAAVVPLNPAAPVADGSYILAHSGARGLFATSELLAARDKEAFVGFSLPIEGLLSAPDATPDATMHQSATPAAQDRGPVGGSLGEHMAVVLYTSGTTGNPKGVALSQRNLLVNAWSMATNFGLDRQPTTQFAVLPLYHAHALGFGLMTALLSGGHLVFTDKLDPFAWQEVIRAEGATVTSVVPTLLPVLMQARVHRDRVPTLRCIMVSSAPLSTSLARDFEERSGIPLIQGWGLSEYTNFACCQQPDIDLDPQRHRRQRDGWEVPSIGGPLPGVELEVRDEEDRPLPADTPGELWVRGPSLMLSYYRDPATTRNAIVDGWLRTGDEGIYREVDGRTLFFITGRKKEIIIRDGDKYSPLAVERKLLGMLLPELQELEERLVVLGFPHRLHGEEIGAYLETASLTEPRLSEITEKLRAALFALPADQRPKIVLRGTAPIPRTHTGKIQRRKLQGLFAPYADCKGEAKII